MLLPVAGMKVSQLAIMESIDCRDGSEADSVQACL